MKLYAANNGLSYKYYQPANGDQATDDDRYDAMKAAAEGGAKVIVAAGFMQATALTKAAAEFTDVKFVFVDRDSAVTTEDGTALKNVLGICFQEEQCGYLAGYAVVKEGYTKWASPVVAAATTLLAAVTATASCRALPLLLPRWA